MKRSKIVIASTKSWNLNNARVLHDDYQDQFDIRIIADRAILTTEYLEDFMPEWVFFPHWSWIIPDEITSRWRCVIFHTSPLPWGRGGTPIQNQIARGIYESEVCAVRATSELDAGPVYTRETIDLSKGSVEEILIQVSSIVFQMIPKIVVESMQPKNQTGKPVSFARRKPSDSKLPKQTASLRSVYDHIRMLDGEGYPPAFLEWGNQIMELFDARLRSDGSVTGSFRLQITNKEDKQ